MEKKGRGNVVQFNLKENYPDIPVTPEVPLYIVEGVELDIDQLVQMYLGTAAPGATWEVPLNWRKIVIRQTDCEIKEENGQHHIRTKEQRNKFIILKPGTQIEEATTIEGALELVCQFDR